MSDEKGKADALKKACEYAYLNYNSSCSHAVRSVTKDILGENAYKEVELKNANALMTHFRLNWKKVTDTEAQNLADKGVLVVAGRSEMKRSGHVVVVYPGGKKPRGGYKNAKGEMVRTAGNYPRAMSTSSGNWPGEKSNGEKTVWDSWGRDSRYKTIEYYTPK